MTPTPEDLEKRLRALGEDTIKDRIKEGIAKERKRLQRNFNRRVNYAVKRRLAERSSTFEEARKYLASLSLTADISALRNAINIDTINQRLSEILVDNLLEYGTINSYRILSEELKRSDLREEDLCERVLQFEELNNYLGSGLRNMSNSVYVDTDDKNLVASNLPFVRNKN